MTKQIVVFKAWEGWCDRLQVLTHLIKYCRNRNARLCVLWDDMVWGGGEFGFDEVMELVGVDTATKHEALRAMVQQGAKVHPPHWTFEDVYFRMPGRRAHLVGLNSVAKSYIPSIMTHNEPPVVNADVIVTNGDGDRLYDLSEFTTHVRFRPWVVEGIKTILADFDPHSFVVHLRGTDRPDEGYVTNAIRILKEEFRLPIYVVTDELRLWEEFKAGVPHAKLVNPNSSSLRIKLPSKRGLHFALPSELKEQGITKKELLIEFLADWFALVFAHTAVGREKSTYFMMARALHGAENAVASDVLGGWKPQTKSCPDGNEAPVLSHREQEETGGAVAEFVPTT